MVQNEARLARGRVGCVRRGTAGFSMWGALGASADETWAIRVSSAGDFGARRGEGLGREGERVNRMSMRPGEDGLGEEVCMTRAWWAEDVTWSQVLILFPGPGSKLRVPCDHNFTIEWTASVGMNDVTSRLRASPSVTYGETRSRPSGIVRVRHYGSTALNLLVFAFRSVYGPRPTFIRTSLYLQYNT